MTSGPIRYAKIAYKSVKHDTRMTHMTADMSRKFLCVFLQHPPHKCWLVFFCSRITIGCANADGPSSLYAMQTVYTTATFAL